MKLFHAQGSCSLGIRVLLETIGAPFEVHAINLAKGEQRDPAYLAQNPKGKVPALIRPDGQILTEYPLISLWLAQNFPQANLLPRGADGQWQAMQLVEFVVASLHMRGATFAMRPDKFTADPAFQAQLRAHGQAVLKDGFALLAEQLGKRAYFFDHFTIADAAVFYLLHWKARFDIDLPPTLEAYYQNLSSLPSVQRALQPV